MYHVAEIDILSLENVMCHNDIRLWRRVGYYTVNYSFEIIVKKTSIPKFWSIVQSGELLAWINV